MFLIVDLPLDAKMSRQQIHNKKDITPWKKK